MVAESAYTHDYNLDFVTRKIIYSDDGTKARVDETVIDYSGNFTTTTICDYTDTDTAYDLVYGNTEEPAFNDGLVRAGEADGCWLGGLKDINNTVKFMCATESYYLYSYNLGILCENENNGFMGPDVETLGREFKTTFTMLMTDNSVYEFNCAIGGFNDDGYALMQVNGKYYVVKLKKGIIPTVFYNNKKIAFDQIPVIENGRTLVPLRAIFETLGAEVQWDSATNTVTATKDGTEIKLTIDSTTAYKNGEAITLDVPAKIINSRTLVPVRFVSDCFGVNVNWNGTMLRVDLTK